MNSSTTTNESKNSIITQFTESSKEKECYSLKLQTIEYVLWNNLFIPAMKIKSESSGNIYTAIANGWMVQKYYTEDEDVSTLESFDETIKREIEILGSLTNENNTYVLGIFGNKLIRFTIFTEDYKSINELLFLGLQLGLNHLITITDQVDEKHFEKISELEEKTGIEEVDLSYLLHNLYEILEPTTLPIDTIIQQLQEIYQIKRQYINHIQLENLYWNVEMIPNIFKNGTKISYPINEYLIGSLQFAKGPIWGYKLADVYFTVDMTTLCGKSMYNFEDGFY